MNSITTLVEARFEPHYHNKYATLMAAGNGALGVRATHEEAYTTQTRGMFLAGLYHRAGEGETTELVNLPDLVGMDIELNGEIFSLLSGEILSYRRELCFASGELTRTVEWRSPHGQRFTLKSERFVSATRLGLFCLRLAITPVDSAATVRVATGIDATQTNSGRQHLAERELRVFENSYLQARYRTLDNVSDVTLGCVCRVNAQAQVSFRRKTAGYCSTVSRRSLRAKASRLRNAPGSARRLTRRMIARQRRRWQRCVNAPQWVMTHCWRNPPRPVASGGNRRASRLKAIAVRINRRSISRFITCMP